MIVLDASILVEALLMRPAADAILERISKPDVTLHAPHLIDIEVAHAVRRLALRGEITAALGGYVMEQLEQFPLERYPHQDLLQGVWTLRHSLSAYDAAFVTLAEILDAPLLTRDRRLASAHGHGARIEMI